MALKRLSETDAWSLASDDSDIRGWTVREQSGEGLGEIVDFIVDADEGAIEAVVLDTGRQYPAQDLRLDDGNAFLDPGGLDVDLPSLRHVDGGPDRVVEGAPRSADVAETVSESVREDAFRRHFRSTYGSEIDEYERYQPAYQHGYRHGTLEEFREQQYEQARRDLRRRYEEEHGDGTFGEVEEAVAYGFGHARQ